MADVEQFRLLVEGVFDVTGRGTAAVGQILSGVVRRGDRVAVEGRGSQPAECVWIDAAPRVLKTLEDGRPRVGLFVPSWTTSDAHEGDVLVVVDPAEQRWPMFEMRR